MSPLEVPDVKTFRGPSGDIPGTSRAGWDDNGIPKIANLLNDESKKLSKFRNRN